MSERDFDECAPKNEKTIDFSTTIIRLELRANKARQRVRWVSSILIFFVIGMVFFIMQNLIVGRNKADFAQYKSFVSSQYDSRLESYNLKDSDQPFVRRAYFLMNSLIGPDLRYRDQKGAFTPPSAQEAEKIRNDLQETVTQLEKISKIKLPEPTNEIKNQDYSTIVASSVFSLGAVAFSVLLIQIATMFIRYHSRLAELYDAQADSFRASAGNPTIVCTLLQNLSPSTVDFDKSPITIYEKALETIRDVARKP